MSLRYDVVRFAYAGESKKESRRVVKEDGRLERENCALEEVGGGFGGDSASSAFAALSISFPRPIFS